MRVQRWTAALALLSTACLGAVTNVRVMGTTSTQAVIEYTAPSFSACTVEVSESASYTPLVHDVNPALFAGSDQDDRYGNVTSGRSRTIVVGKRTAEKAADGKYYSRALQTYTTHYYRVTCNGETATGTFRTRNIPLGTTYNEPIPVDPNEPGATAWPTFEWDVPVINGPAPLSSSGTTVVSTGHGLAAHDFIVLRSGPQAGEVRQVASVNGANQATLARAFTANQSGVSWGKRTPERSNTAQTVIDPQTGILFRRLTSPGVVTGNLTNKDGGIDSVQDQGGGWSSGAAQAMTEAGDGQAAACSGAGCSTAWLVVRSSLWDANNAAYGYASDYQLVDSVRVKVQGNASGGAGENAKLEYCLTLDGATCFTAVKEIDLTTCSSAMCVLGDERPALKYWEDSADPLRTRVARPEIYTREGTADYDATTRTLTWKTGSYFNERWGNGSLVFVGGNPYLVEQVLDMKRLRLAAGPATGTGYAFRGRNFGVMFRKKTSATNSVSLDYVRFSLDLSDGMVGMWSTVGMCATAPTQQTYNGVTREGYHCHLGASWGETQLWWIDRETADGALLGMYYSGKPGEWNTSMLNMGSANWSKQNPNVVYGGITRLDGDTGLVRVEYQGDNTSRAVYFLDSTSWLPDSTWNQVTSTSIQAGAAAFTAAHPEGPQFDAARFRLSNGTCTITSSNDMAVGRCTWGSAQDRYGWITVQDATTGEMKAATPTHGYFPLRHCVLHGAGHLAYDGYAAASMTVNPWPGGTVCGSGPLVTELAAALPATGAETCPENPFAQWPPASGSGCSTVTVTGEPYDPTPCATENSNRGASGPYGALQVAQLGDVFRVENEYIQLLAKNGNQWTFLRGYNGSSVTAHVTGATASGYCGGATLGAAGYLYWNYPGDPLGQQGIQSVKYGFPQHGARDLGPYNRTAHVAEGAYCKGNGVCYLVFDGLETTHTKILAKNPDRVMMIRPKFAGAVMFPPVTSHLSYNQVKEGDGDWAVDEWPVLWAEQDDGEWVNVSGTLYRKNRAAKLIRKRLGTRASCGTHPLLDVSGPASQITDGSADRYKYCVAERNGECYSGSAAGDVFVNCPFVNRTHCSESGEGACGGSGREACTATGEGDNILQDICVNSISGWSDAWSQFGVDGYTNDRNAAWSRWMGRHMARYRRVWQAASPLTLPDASWALVYTRWLDGIRSEWLAAKLPPWPGRGDGWDSEARWTFRAIPVRLAAAPSGAAKASVEFGYNPQFECTSRKESCIATTETVSETEPFSWASDSYSAATCSSGCRISIPAIPQRVVYYRVRYLRADGTTLMVGRTQVTVVD